MTHLPKFSPALLHPRYWLLWLGIGLLWLVVQLPYPLIYRLGNAIGRLAMRFMKRRAKIAYRNLELCFPEKSEQERHRMVVMNFESVGMGLMETGMAWFWPVRRIARWTDTICFEHIRDVQAAARHSADRYSFPHSRDGCADVRYERTGDWRLSPQRQPGDRLAADLGSATIQ